MRYKSLGIGIGVDFDGTLFEEKDFPSVGNPIHERIYLVNYLYKLGFTIVIWTLRCESKTEAHTNMIDAMDEYGVKYDYINETPEHIRNEWGDQRKIGVHYFIDDRNAGGIPDNNHILAELFELAISMGRYSTTNHSGLNQMELDIEERYAFEADKIHYQSLNNTSKVIYQEKKTAEAEKLVEELKSEIDELQTEIQMLKSIQGVPKEWLVGSKITEYPRTKNECYGVDPYVVIDPCVVIKHQKCPRCSALSHATIPNCPKCGAKLRKV